MPIRVYDLAKKLGIESADVIAKAKALDIAKIVVPTSGLDAEVALRIEAAINEDLKEMLKHGLQAFSLENFKAFAAAQTVPIRPLTLVFGPNSSGKSSFIHGLLLAHHAMETGELDTFKTSLGGDAVDLGGFRQYIHRRDADAFAGFVMIANVQAAAPRLREFLPKTGKTLKMEVRWGVPVFQDDADGPRILRKPGVRVCDFYMDGESLVRLFRRPDGKFQIKTLKVEMFQTALWAMIGARTTTSAQQGDYEIVAKSLSALAGELHFSGDSFLPGALVADSVPIWNTNTQLIPISRGERESDVGGAVRLFGADLISKLVAGLVGVFSRQLRRLSYLGPLRSFPPRHIPFGEIQTANWAAGGGIAWDILRKDEDVRASVNKWLVNPERLSTPFEVELRRHVAIKDIKGILEDEFQAIQVDPPQREPGKMHMLSTWNLHGKLPEEIQRKIKLGEISQAEIDRMVHGGEVPGIEKDEELHFLDYDVGVPTGKVLKRIGDELSTIDDLALIDKRTNTVVSHRDVGIGISQVLPVLVQAYGYRERLIAIEQPEIHLHPALQAELGDVFIESALGERKNTFILETHSEHLILRILRRVRETTEGRLPPGVPPIRPEDISVVFVEPTAKGSIIREMPVTPDGDFGAPWPGGFFAERLADLP